jgi:hypothetical protein
MSVMYCNTHRTIILKANGRSRRVAYDVDQGHSLTRHPTYMRVSDASVIRNRASSIGESHVLYDTPNTFAARSMVGNSDTCSLQDDTLKLSEKVWRSRFLSRQRTPRTRVK